MINQEFGDSRYVPMGISGDFELIANEVASTEKVAVQAFIATRIDELAAKVNLGTATSGEEAELIRHFSAEVAQGYN